MPVTTENGSLNAVRLPDLLFTRPVVTVPGVSPAPGTSHQPAYDLVNQFETPGILREIPGKKMYKNYLFAGDIHSIVRGTGQEQSPGAPHRNKP